MYKDGRVLIEIHVQPKASRIGFTGLYDAAVKLNISSAPVDGKANAAVIKFLATFLHVRKKDLEIKHGLQSRKKTILVSGVSLEEIRVKMQGIF